MYKAPITVLYLLRTDKNRQMWIKQQNNRFTDKTAFISIFEAIY